MASAIFADGVMAGSTGCNRYHAPYRVAANALELGAAAMTMMACGPAQTAVERAFTEALDGVATFALAGDTLELADAAGRASLRFNAARVPSLTGMRWTATAINNGRGGMVSLLDGTEVDATLDDEGRIAGSGGCNRYSGIYAVEGAGISIGPVASTLRACLAPEGVGEQEAWFFAALGRVARWSIAEGRLQLRSADGALQVELRAEPSR
jgi:heat shock protein HslJ